MESVSWAGPLSLGNKLVYNFFETLYTDGNYLTLLVAKTIQVWLEDKFKKAYWVKKHSHFFYTNNQAKSNKNSFLWSRIIFGESDHNGGAVRTNLDIGKRDYSAFFLYC